MSIRAEPWPEGYDRLIFEELDSTNAQAARIAGDLTRPTWIMAHRQTAARGRQGRRWSNPEGNLAATLVLRPRGPVSDAALRSFLAANALYETLALYVDCTKLALKWPNDVLLSNGKVAGILLESAGTSQGLDWLAIGIGVNLQQAPEVVRDARVAPIALADATDAEIDACSFLDRLAGYYADQETLFAQRGFDAIRDVWLGRAARLGEIITARTSRTQITGRFDGIDHTGNLVLLTSDGPQKIAAADVFF